MADGRRRMNRRERRYVAGRWVLLLIMAVTAVLIVTGLAFLIALGAHSCAKDPSGKTPGKQGTSAGGEIQYQEISMSAGEVGKGELIIVNKEHAYVFPSADKNSTTGLTVARSILLDGAQRAYLVADGVWIRQSAKEALDRMLSDYCRLDPANNSSVMLVEAFRNYTNQESSTSVKAGFSDHHTGYLMNLADFSTTGTGVTKALTADQNAWINANCQNYGIVPRYPDGHSAHTFVDSYQTAYRYVGVPHAVYMSGQGLCLEEYVERLRTEYTERHLTVAVGEAKYEIYYVPVSTEADTLTAVPVPSNYEYTVSGDNIGGLIVTVDLSQPKK